MFTNDDKATHETLTAQSRKELIDICTRGTDNLHEVQYRCPACSGCKQCQHGAKLGLASSVSIQEQQDIESNIEFKKHDHSELGYYISKLPLIKNHENSMHTNYESVNQANIKLLEQLRKKNNGDAEDIAQSYNDLVKHRFIIPIKELPKEQQDYINKSQVKNYIPNAVAYKSDSHSTKIRICWDGTRVTGKGSTLNSQLMRGLSTYSMTKSLLMFRRGKFALSCDISKFYNRLYLDPVHYNLHLSVWRPDMNPESIAEVFVLVRHFYGVASTAAIMQACMNDAAAVARKIGMHDVATTIELAFVDDCLNSLDEEKKLLKLKADLNEFMTSKGFPIKGFALSGSKPDKTLSPDDHLLVGGWHWWPESEQMRLKIPIIYLGKKQKGRYKDGSIFLHNPKSKKDIQNFYKHFPLTLAHILSRTASLYDQSGAIAPIAGYGRWITRLALEETKATFLDKVSDKIKALFVDYLWQIHCFGDMDIQRNFGVAINPERATLLVYFDAGHEGELCIFHLQYETDKQGKFHTEFLFSLHCLVPRGRNVPYSELDSAYKASARTDIILDWLQNFITRKALIGDAQICLFWLLNRVKRTNTYIRNRIHTISRTFNDSEIFYVKSESNPADIGTKFRHGFENAYTLLADGQPFRTGPDFMKNGLQAAIDNEDIENITTMKISLEKKREARRQTFMPEEEHDPSETMTPAEVTLVIAIEDLSEHDIVDDPETVMLYTDNSQNIEIETTFPKDEVISTKIAERMDFSKYIISPTCKSYSKMHDTTTLAFLAIHCFMKATKSTKCSNMANKYHPSASVEGTNQFVLGRNEEKGALYQKFKHSQIHHLEQKAERIIKQQQQSKPALEKWKELANDRTNRLSAIAAGTTDQAHTDWANKVEESISKLIDFNRRFKTKEDNKEKRTTAGLSQSSIQELLSCSFSPADDNRIKLWLSYPGMVQAVKRSREINSMVENITQLSPGSIQTLMDLLTLTFKCAMALASSQAGPVAVSILAQSISRADDALSNIGGNQKTTRTKADWNKLWKRTSSILSSKQQTWPTRRFHRIGRLFVSAEQYTDWSKVTGKYLMQKASAECEHFLTSSKLNKIGVKDEDGIWKARHRLFNIDENKHDLNIPGDPFLIEARSPLAWSIALHVHNKAAAPTILGRPSSKTHKHWRECHRKSLEFGVILGYQSIFKRIEKSCMMCIKRRARVCRVAGGPLHFSQYMHTKHGADSVYKYIMLDLTAALKFEQNQEQNVLYTLVSVCLVSKHTHVVSLENKKKESFLIALNVLFGEVGLPSKLYVDEEKGLLATHRDMLVEVNEVIMKEHNIEIEQVTAQQHSAHGLVERRMKFFGEQIGTLNVQKANITKTEASNYMRIIAARLNEKPYGLRYINHSDIGPLDSAQDLQMELITPNHWRTSNRSQGTNAAFVHLPGTLKEHQLEVSNQLEKLAHFFDEKLLPTVILDIDRKRIKSDPPLHINSIVLFWKLGNDGTRPKHSQPKLARVIALQTGSDGKQRSATISYSNADQIKIDKNGQIAGGSEHESNRSIDQLIPVDDASQLRSVEAMLNMANNMSYRRTPPTKSEENMEDTTKTEVVNPPAETKEANTPTTDEEDATEEEMEEDTTNDPTYKYKARTIQTSNRVTRSNKGQGNTHCSLVIEH